MRQKINYYNTPLQRIFRPPLFPSTIAFDKTLKININTDYESPVIWSYMKAENIRDKNELIF